MRNKTKKTVSIFLTIVMIVGFTFGSIVNAAATYWVGVYNYYSEHGRVKIDTTYWSSQGWTTSSGTNLEGGTEITVNAKPDPGYKFTEWVDEDNNHVTYDQEYSFTLTEKTMLYALFEVNPELNTSAELYDLSLGQFEEDYNADDYLAYLKMKTGNATMYVSEEYLTIELTGDTDDFIFDYTLSSELAGYGVTDTLSSYDIASVKPVEGLEPGTYSMTATLSYDEDGLESVSDKEILDTATISFTVLNPSNTSWVGVYNYYSEHGRVSIDTTYWSSQGWETSSGTNLENGTEVTVNANPDSGYTFVEWVDEDNNHVTYDQEYSFTLTEETKLYAIFIQEYNISFDSNGGSTVAAQTVTDGSKATKPTDPTKSGYTFGGWFTDSACTTAYDFNSAVTSDITLYAKWTAVTTPAPATPAPTTPAPATPAPSTPAPEPEFDPYANVPTLTGGIAHVQDIGDVSYTTEAGVLTIGTRGMGKRLEEITINFENTTGLTGTLEYRVHVQDYGWMEWVPAGTKCGTEGEAKRIEAIELRFTGELAEYYSVEYCVHIQDYGDMQGWVKDGALAGTTGESKRIEELKIRIVPKHSGSTMSVKYRVHVQDYGWEGAYASNGQMSGTSGESKRLEGIEIFLDGNQYSGGVKFKTHVQDYGWQGWSYDGEMSGTQGESKRLEGICIELYGEIAEYYDIYYRVHAQDIGWMAWAKNGECAGTAGRSARLEGIQIVLVPKGSPAPGATFEGITAVTDKAFVEGF